MCATWCFHQQNLYLTRYTSTYVLDQLRFNIIFRSRNDKSCIGEEEKSLPSHIDKEFKSKISSSIKVISISDHKIGCNFGPTMTIKYWQLFIRSDCMIFAIWAVECEEYCISICRRGDITSKDFWIDAHYGLAENVVYVDGLFNCFLESHGNILLGNLC